jgi:pimeloyl-ACP methyl ester carboxylesterase
MSVMGELEYTPLPARVQDALAHEGPPREELVARVAAFAGVQPRPEDADGDVEVLDGVEMTHRFAEAPGDSELLRWHYVEAGRRDGEPVVFLHGLPESWFMWHGQMAALSRTHRCVAVDLKGYGQSDKRTGDYRQEGVAEQLLALLDVLGIDRFNLVTHDRGTVIADYLAANHAERVLRYVRGEQHLYHFHPALAPQELLFTDPDRAGILRQPNRVVPGAYLNLARDPIADEDIVRSIQEFSYPKIGWAVPRYFNSSSFRKEWIDRRTRLMAAWRFPVLILQGAADPRQPREFYEGVEHHMPDARVRFIDAGHFFVFEQPAATTAAISEFLAQKR